MQTIIYETDKHYVTARDGGGYEIWRNGATAAERCGIVGYAGDIGLRRAIAEIQRREGTQ